jgi:hypothetical protein
MPVAFASVKRYNITASIHILLFFSQKSVLNCGLAFPEKLAYSNNHSEAQLRILNIEFMPPVNTVNLLLIASHLCCASKIKAKLFLT